MVGEMKAGPPQFPHPTKTDDMADFRQVRDDIQRQIVQRLVDDPNYPAEMLLKYMTR